MEKLLYLKIVNSVSNFIHTGCIKKIISNSMYDFKTSNHTEIKNFKNLFLVLNNNYFNEVI